MLADTTPAAAWVTPLPVADRSIVAPVRIWPEFSWIPPVLASSTSAVTAPRLDAAIIVSLVNVTFAPVTVPIVRRLPVLISDKSPVAAKEPNAKIVLPVPVSANVPAAPVSVDIPIIDPNACEIRPVATIVTGLPPKSKSFSTTAPAVVRFDTCPTTIVDAPIFASVRPAPPTVTVPPVEAGPNSKVFAEIVPLAPEMSSVCAATETV